MPSMRLTQVVPALSVSKTPIDVAAKICWLRSRNEFDFMDDRSNGHPFQALALRYPLVAAVKAFKDRIAFGAGVHVGGKQGIDGKRNHARMSHAF